MSTGSCITLASYNMHKAVGLDGRRDPHRVLQVLQEIDADIPRHARDLPFRHAEVAGFPDDVGA